MALKKQTKLVKAKKTNAKKPTPDKAGKASAKKINDQQIAALMSQMTPTQQPQAQTQIAPATVPGLPPFLPKKKKGK